MTTTDEGFARLHDDAWQTLEAWEPATAEQEGLRREYQEFLSTHPDAMSRSCRVGHLTASALVIDASRRHVLLTLHPKAGRWLQLGGHVEPGDASLRDAALRETIEEGGIVEVEISSTPIHLDRHPVSCWGSPSEHLDVEYLAVVPDGSVPVISAESDDLRWFPMDDLPDGLDKALLAMIAIARR